MRHEVPPGPVREAVSVPSEAAVDGGLHVHHRHAAGVEIVEGDLDDVAVCQAIVIWDIVREIAHGEAACEGHDGRVR